MDLSITVFGCCCLLSTLERLAFAFAVLRPLFMRLAWACVCVLLSIQDREKALDFAEERGHKDIIALLKD
jgi:hypothetical protein